LRTVRTQLLLASAAAAACTINADYGGTEYRCSDDVCPSGFECTAAKMCVPVGTADAAADGAAGGDAAPSDGGEGLDASLLCLDLDNDTCGGAMDLTDAARMAGGTRVFGTTTGYTGDLNPSVIIGCTESPEPGPDAIFRLDAAAGEDVVVELAPDAWDAGVYLLDGCAGTATCLGGSDAIGDNLESFSVGVAAGTYYLVVDSAVSGTGCYWLDVSLE
jgi:hypothetical protein